MTLQFQKHLLVIQQVCFIMCLICFRSWVFTRLRVNSFQLNYGCFMGRGNGSTSRSKTVKIRQKKRSFTGSTLKNLTFVEPPKSKTWRWYKLQVFLILGCLCILIPIHPPAVLDRTRYYQQRGEKKVPVSLYRTLVTSHFECTVLGIAIMKIQSHTVRESLVGKVNLFSYKDLEEAGFISCLW